MFSNTQFFIHRRLTASIALATALSPLAFGQGSLNARPRITSRIEDTHRITLPGNVRPAALAATDKGLVSDALPLEHILLTLQRSPERAAALKSYVDTLNDSSGPNFHQWLKPAELGEQYGPAQTDIAAATTWLQSHGFTINSVAATGMTLDISGTARAVRSAFGTPLHNLSANGVAHTANLQEPSIPAALAPVVSGVVSLNDFRPRAFHHNVKAMHFDPRTGSRTTEGTSLTAAGTVHPDYTFTSGGSVYEAMVPGDLATIYNLNPLFKAGISGQGQTIAVIEDTDVYSADDWTTFRNTFGLGGFTSGSFTQVHPGDCTDPGDNTDDSEAILDAEWASAAAPSAAIVLASCADTSTTFGGLLALNGLINSNNPPRIISVSYGESESDNGAAGNAAYYNAYQSAAAEGISVFVSSGDSGAASSDANRTNATHGITVSGLASTPYNVAVGGTDFGDTATGTNPLYWNTANTSTYTSAKSYIPEIPWNNSCASQLIASAVGYTTTYGTDGFCNSAIGKQYFLTTAAASGGPSGCATGAASIQGVVSGTCAGYAKPLYQYLVAGNPHDGVRDIPDVSLFAANGVWGHYYVFCYSNLPSGGSPCTGEPSTWSGAGGTSFASPIMAAIQSLVNQKTGTPWGNPNYIYYLMAGLEYGLSGNSNCNSSNGNAVGSSCVFYDVTAGDMDVNCTGRRNCFRPSGTYGVLSTSDAAYLPAYATGTGWDFATGIGTVNALNLVKYWP